MKRVIGGCVHKLALVGIKLFTEPLRVSAAH